VQLANLSAGSSARMLILVKSGVEIVAANYVIDTVAATLHQFAQLWLWKVAHRDHFLM